MGPPRKTIADTEFAADVLAEHEQLAKQDGLTAAERQVFRELLGYVVDIREIVGERRWQAAERVVYAASSK